ncbi:MAG: TatD family hydrolase [Candidatus Margulisiibacteriota bacterium]
MIDTHAHLHLIRQPLPQILSAAKKAGVTHIIQVAIDVPSIEENIRHYNQYSEISITGGIHPLSVTSDLNINETMASIEQHLNQFVAIGEAGLDYKYGREHADLQKDWFYAQLDLAQRCDKPIVIHSRHADEDMLAIVNQFPNVKKVFHCYATNLAFFESLRGDQNYASFTGMITFSRKGKLANAVRNIPLSKLMIETDAPYLLPKGVQADQNAPEFVGRIAAHIASLREITTAEVVNQCNETAKLFFGLK